MEFDLQNEYMPDILEALARSYFTTLVVDVAANRYQVVRLSPDRGECGQDGDPARWETREYTGSLHKQLTAFVREADRQRVEEAISLPNLCAQLHRDAEGRDHTARAIMWTIRWSTVHRRSTGTAPLPWRCALTRRAARKSCC